MTRPALLILAALALILARRSPAWRPLAASLAALACIDVARLWVAPLAATRAQPWWGVDVALVALWPVAIGVGLLRVQRIGGSAQVPSCDNHVVIPSKRYRESHGGAPKGRGCKPQHERSEVVHPPILPRLALLAALALTLGACRPWLPVLAYLGTLRALRWGLAGLWAEAVVCAVRKDEGPGAFPPWRSSHPSPIAPVVAGVTYAGSQSPPHASASGPCLSTPKGDGGENSRSRAAAQACALVLAGCNVAGLVAGAWLVPPWEPPAWALAGPVTWAAYAVCGVVMGREAWRVRGRRA